MFAEVGAGYETSGAVVRASTCESLGKVSCSHSSQLLRTASDTMAEYLASIFGTENDK